MVAGIRLCEDEMQEKYLRHFGLHFAETDNIGLIVITIN